VRRHRGILNTETQRRGVQTQRREERRREGRRDAEKGGEKKRN
jgi:hypothetical protein